MYVLKGLVVLVYLGETLVLPSSFFVLVRYLCTFVSIFVFMTGSVVLLIYEDIGPIMLTDD